MTLSPNSGARRIIKDLVGEKYTLTQTRLAARQKDISGCKFYILRDDVKLHKFRWARLRVVNYPEHHFIRVPFGNNSIGCTDFSPAEFAKITKLWKVKP